MQTNTSKLATGSFLAICGISAVAYLFLYGGSHGGDAEAEAEEEHQEWIVLSQDQIRDANIEIQTAGPGQVQVMLQVPAKLILNQDSLVHVVPKANGVLHEAKKNVGDKVSKGEVLAILESKDVAETKSVYFEALKKKQFATSNLEREQGLFSQHISASQDYHNAVAEAEQARVQLNLKQQNLQALGFSGEDIIALENESDIPLSRYELVSPTEGVIIERPIVKGAYLDTSREAFVIADLSSLWAELAMSPRDLDAVKEQMSVHIDCPDAASLGYTSQEAQIVSVSPIIDPDTRTVKVLATISNSHGHLRPHTYVCAKLKGKPEDVPLVVTKEAIQTIDGETTLFVYSGDRFDVRPVKTGRDDGRFIEVISGISPGEQYASKNTFILKAEHGKDEAQHMD